MPRPSITRRGGRVAGIAQLSRSRYSIRARTLVRDGLTSLESPHELLPHSSVRLDVDHLAPRALRWIRNLVVPLRALLLPPLPGVDVRARPRRLLRERRTLRDRRRV